MICIFFCHLFQSLLRWNELFVSTEIKMTKFALQRNESYAKLVASEIESILNHELGGFALPKLIGLVLNR